MPNTLTSLFDTLLTSDELTVALQERIYRHGVRHQAHGMLAKLALHPSLDATIDEKLKLENAAAVRAAWISRPGRAAEAVADMVTKEKRSTILTALASQLDLPAEAQSALIDQTNNVNVLCTLATNPHADADQRRRAADKLVESLTVADGPGLSDKHLTTVGRLRDGYPGYLAEIVPSTSNLHVLYVAAGCMALDADAQRRLLENFTTTFAASLMMKPESRYAYASEAQSQFRSLVEELCESSDISDDARTTMHTTLQNIAKLYDKDTYRRNDFEAAIKTLKDSTGSRYAEIIDQLNAADSSEAVSAFIGRVNGIANSQKLSIRSTFLHSLASRIIASPLCTVDHILAMEDWYSWYSAPDLVKLVNDPRMQAAIVEAQSFSIDYDSVLDAVTDKHALIDEMIAVAVTKGDRYVISSLMSSPHFTATHLKKVPLSMIASLDLDTEFKRLLQEMLNDVAVDDTTWSVIETLSDEFEGSIDDLMKTAAAV